MSYGWTPFPGEQDRITKAAVLLSFYVLSPSEEAWVNIAKMYYLKSHPFLFLYEYSLIFLNGKVKKENKEDEE